MILRITFHGAVFAKFAADIVTEELIEGYCDSGLYDLFYLLIYLLTELSPS
jgi:hypothetical protein